MLAVLQTSHRLSPSLHRKSCNDLKSHFQPIFSTVKSNATVLKNSILTTAPAKSCVKCRHSGPKCQNPSASTTLPSQTRTKDGLKTKCNLWDVGDKDHYPHQWWVWAQSSPRNKNNILTRFSNKKEAPLRVQQRCITNWAFPYSTVSSNVPVKCLGRSNRWAHSWVRGLSESFSLIERVSKVSKLTD